MKINLKFKRLSATRTSVTIFFNDASSFEIVLVKGTQHFFCLNQLQLFVFLALPNTEQKEIEEAIGGSVERLIHHQ